MKSLTRFISRTFTALWLALDLCRRVVLNLVFIGVVILLVAWMLSVRRPAIPESAVMVLAPAGTIVEQRTQSGLANKLIEEDDFGSETVLKDILDALDEAKDDPRIKAILLDLSKFQNAGLSKLQDIGSALMRFRQSGKPVISSADFYRQKAYALAAHSSRVYLNPLGGVLLTGFGVYQNYFRSAMDKLGVELHVFKVGKYKSALEPFTRDDMSAFDKEANRALTDVLWDNFRRDVAGARGIEPESIDDYVNHLPARLGDSQGNAGALALAYRLVDGLKTPDQVRDELIQLVGEDPSQHSFYQVRFEDYLDATATERKKRGTKPKVGIVVAEGTILDGIQPAGKIGSTSLSALIAQARKDPEIRALVLRIDSPGGSAAASEIIRRELELTRQAGKPVVVSMSSVAASGAYWIASGADEIWAAPTTITGSIGIFSAFPTFERGLEKFGISNDGVGTTRLADAFNPSRPMNTLLAQALNQMMENGYNTFVARVAEGRRMPIGEVERIAEGRVWAGQTAKEIGLVDQLGGLDEALASAAHKAGLGKDFSTDYLQAPLTRREQLLKTVNEFLAAMIRSSFGSAPTALERLGREAAVEDLAQLDGAHGMFAYCLTCRLF